MTEIKNKQMRGDVITVNSRSIVEATVQIPTRKDRRLFILHKSKKWSHCVSCNPDKSQKKKEVKLKSPLFHRFSDVGVQR
jgi:hypothetical protein